MTINVDRHEEFSSYLMGIAMAVLVSYISFSMSKSYFEVSGGIVDMIGALIYALGSFLSVV